MVARHYASACVAALAHLPRQRGTLSQLTAWFLRYCATGAQVLPSFLQWETTVTHQGLEQHRTGQLHSTWASGTTRLANTKLCRPPPTKANESASIYS